jgi:hypothetical protein
VGLLMLAYPQFVITAVPGHGRRRLVRRLPAARQPPGGNPAMNTPSATARRPLPGCPAIAGQGTEIGAARFTLIAEDCELGSDGQPSLTEVFGYWQLPGQDSEDLVHVDGFTVRARSSAALTARKVAASRRRTRIAGELLRAAITACSCTRPAGCPAYDGTTLLDAIEHAASQSLSRGHLTLLPVPTCSD